MILRNKKAILIIMSRWAAPGRCKRRLATDLGPIKACSIQQRLTSHTLCVASELEKKGFLDYKLAISGIPSKTAKRLTLFKEVKMIENQGGGSLGLRMRRLILRTQNRRNKNNKHPRATIVIGSDLPSLCKTDLINALDALNQHKMVIGPASDGGYWLIGLSAELLTPVAYWPFCGIPWGTNEVLNRTTKKADQAGITYSLLGIKNDIDKLSDLIPWQG